MADAVVMIFEEAFEEFISQERANIINKVNERNLCGRLAMYLERARERNGFPGYYADIEYNRKHGKIKTIIDETGQIITINCDLILHSRGEIPARDNLIAIEMKRAGRSSTEVEQDCMRLRAMTKAIYDNVWTFDGVTLPEHVCGYELGVFVYLDADKARYKVEFFQHGVSVAIVDGKF